MMKLETKHFIIPKPSRVLFSNDGTKVAISGLSGGVLIFSDDFNSVEFLQGHIEETHSLAWSPDDKSLACSQVVRTDGSEQNNVQTSLVIWGVENNKPKQSLFTHSNDFVANLAWSTDGQLLAGSVSNNDIIIWDTLSNEQFVKLAGHSGYAKELHWIDATRLVSFAYDNSIKIWNVHTGVIIFDVADVDYLSISHDSSLLLYILQDGTVHILDTASLNQLDNLIAPKSKLQEAFITSDNAYMLGIGEDGKAIIWDINSGKQLNFNNTTSNCVTIAVHPQLSMFAVVLDNNSVELLNIPDLSGTILVEKASHRIKSLNWSPEGTKLLGTLAGNGIWMWETAPKIQTLVKPDENLVELDGLLSISIHPSRDSVLQGFEGGKYRIHNLQSKDSHVLSANHHEPIYSIQWSPDGNRYLVGGYYGSINVFNTNGNRRLKSFKLDGTLLYVEWQSNDKVIGFLSSNTSHINNIIIIDVNSSKTEMREIEGLNVAWSHDSGRYANVQKSGEEQHSLYVYQQTDLVDVRVLPHVMWNISMMTWKSHSNYIAIGFEDGNINIWDVNDGKLVSKIYGHASEINTIAWHPVDDIIACGGNDNMLSVWDISESKLLYSYYHATPIMAVEWSEDGERLYGASIDGILSIWSRG